MFTHTFINYMRFLVFKEGDCGLMTPCSLVMYVIIFEAPAASIFRVQVTESGSSRCSLPSS
jgi:hypothetical protein